MTMVDDNSGRGRAGGALGVASVRVEVGLCTGPGRVEDRPATSQGPHGAATGAAAAASAAAAVNGTLDVALPSLEPPSASPAVAFPDFPTLLYTTAKPGGGIDHSSCSASL